LRGSSGIAPASLSLLEGKDAQTEGHFKERENTCMGNLPGQYRESQPSGWMENKVSFQMAAKPRSDELIHSL